MNSDRRFIYFCASRQEAWELREILANQASPGSLQAKLVTRLDAALEEAARGLIGRAALFQRTEEL